jgi:mono/diheme cytochrome c family protein
MISSLTHLARKPGIALVALAALAAPFAPVALAADDGDQAAHIAMGRQLFEDWGCGSCHSLKDAGAVGHVGPSFDGAAGLTKEFAVTRITYGQGAMPSFSSMTDEEIDALADYILAVKAQ